MKNTFTLGLLTMALTISSKAQTNSHGWNYSFEVYAMASSITGDASVGRIEGVPVDVGFSDILENLDIAAMVHFEAFRDNQWGFIFDYGFMDLGSDLSNPRGGIVDADVRQGVMESFLTYRMEQNGSTYDFYGGLRWWDNDVKLLVDPGLLQGSLNPRISEDWIDVVVGGRVYTPLGDRWTFTAQVDIGGFDMESDFTASGSIGFIYTLSEKAVIDLRYKGLWVDYKNGSVGSPGGFAYDTTTHGPIVGIIFDL